MPAAARTDLAGHSRKILVITPYGFALYDEPSNNLGVFRLAARPICFAMDATGDRLAAAELRQYRLYTRVCRILAGACDRSARLAPGRDILRPIGGHLLVFRASGRRDRP